jgi:spore germination protein KB
VIAAMILNLPLILMFARSAAVNPGMNLFEILYKQFGKVAGGIFTALFSWYALHVSTLSARNFTEFVATISLKTTPKVFIIIGLIAVAGILAGCKTEIMARWSLIVFIAVFTNLVLTILAALPSMNISYLKPIMEHSLGEIVSTGFSLGSIAYGETIVVLAVIGSLKAGEKPLKAFLLGGFWATILIMMAVLRNIMVLGREMVNSSVFPSFIATRVISPGSFVEHVESVVSFNLILLGITKVSVCLRAASTGIAKILGIEDMAKKCITPICLLSIAICAISFTNFQELIAFVEAYRFYALPFTLLIPAILWVKSEIGRARANKS